MRLKSTDAHQDDIENGEKSFGNTLILGSRGITARQRHFLSTLAMLIKKSTKDAKFDAKNDLGLLNEIADLNSCSKIVYLENRHHADLYMWMTRGLDGPTFKFQVHNMHNFGELCFTGNFILNSRPILSFSSEFNEEEVDGLPMKKLKDLFASVFTPADEQVKGISGYYDHIYQFTLLDGKIWFRNYQIVDGEEKNLIEIGPRFVLDFIFSMDDSFKGKVVDKNPNYKTPTELSANLKNEKNSKYRNAKVQHLKTTIQKEQTDRLIIANDKPSLEFFED